MSETVEWTYWGKLPEVKVFEALALLEGLEPEAAPPDIEGATQQYRKTLRLLLACLSDRTFFTPGTLNMGDPALHGVRLREVGKWAVANGYTLPAKFPRPVQVSKAPPPIVPLRGSSFAPSRKPSPANWSKWKHIPKCPLWKAICLTLDIEPDEDKHGMRNWLRDCRGNPHGLPAEFADRLEIARANVSTNGPIRPQALYAGVLRNPYGEVLLSEVAAASVRWGWTLPQAMQSLVSPAATVTAPEPETYPAIKKEGYVLKKAALIKKYSGEWPSIDADFNHASENGLTAAAKATGHGDWYESAVLAWADQRGKRTATAAKTAPNSVFNLPGRRHTLDG